MGRELTRKKNGTYFLENRVLEWRRQKELSLSIDSLRRAIWQRADEAGGLLIASCGEENSVVTGQNFLAKMVIIGELLTSVLTTNDCQRHKKRKLKFALHYK